ncbi:hypothetical protein D777_01799 [Marinobacter nitratireducens]|uniref:Uncharacterized protein n=1 Tax=Marinobacter nitratireducens TaxID=1137280 RepID=A0A072NEC6_9GAMM|nr:hypothetical protein D777_01799 [Marinobacter nitratireducens]
MTARSFGCMQYHRFPITADIARHRGRLPYFPDPPAHHL